MKIKILLGIFLVSLIFISGCEKEIEKDLEPIEKDLGTDEEKQEILNKFDGYEWSWSCFKDEIKFTLWKEHITNIEKKGNYWLIDGSSSDRGDQTKKISLDESGKILIAYDKENDKVTDWVHGEWHPEEPPTRIADVDEEGNIINVIAPVYC